MLGTVLLYLNTLILLHVIFSSSFGTKRGKNIILFIVGPYTIY